MSKSMVKEIDFDILKDRMVRKTAVAKFFKVSTQTIDRLVKADKFPKPLRVAGMARWVERHISEWAEKQKVKS